MARPDPSTFLPAEASLEEQSIYGGTNNFVGNAATQRANVPMANSGLEATLNPQQQKLTDAQLLDKQRRRMIMFGAIADAGAALQGRDGKMVANLFDYFNNQDQELRKAAAAERELSLREKMLMDMGAAPLGEGASLIEQLEAQKAELMRQAVANPEMIEVIKVQLADIQRRIDETKQQTEQDIQTAQGAGTVLNTVADLSEAIKANPNITGPVGMLLGMLPFTEAGESRLTLETLKANLAFDTLRGIKAGGATLGAVSAPELALLEAKVANLNLNRGDEAVLKSLEEIDRYYKQIVINAYNRHGADTEQLDRMFGGRPAYVRGAEAKDLEMFTYENAPIGELVTYTDEETGRQVVVRYKGGDRDAATSWEEVNY